MFNVAAAPDHAGLHFDAHQFGGQRRSNRYATADISREDSAGMYTVAGPTKRDARWIPEWVESEEALRLVILVRIWQYSKHGRQFRHAAARPKSLDYAAVIRAADRYFNDSMVPTDVSVMNSAQKQRAIQHLESVNRAGGYSALIAAIAYRSLRMGWTASQIAEDLGLTATGVRQHIFRLRECARYLKLESPEENRHWSAGARLPLRRRRAMRDRMLGKAVARG